MLRLNFYYEAVGFNASMTCYQHGLVSLGGQQGLTMEEV